MRWGSRKRTESRAPEPAAPPPALRVGRPPTQPVAQDYDAWLLLVQEQVDAYLTALAQGIRMEPSTVRCQENGMGATVQVCSNDQAVEVSSLSEEPATELEQYYRRYYSYVIRDEPERVIQFGESFTYYSIVVSIEH